MRQPYADVFVCRPDILVSTGSWLSFSYKTYRELKKKLPALFEMSERDTIHVYRDRRGEWGEWFEHWQLIEDKPTIIKEGWM